MNDQLEGIYNLLPTLDCKGLCADSCGPISMTALEHQRVKATTIDGTCSLLKDGRCSAYESRPLICRLWGTMEMNRCPYGCEPSEWVTNRRAAELLAATQAVGGPITQTSRHKAGEAPTRG